MPRLGISHLALPPLSATVWVLSETPRTRLIGRCTAKECMQVPPDTADSSASLSHITEERWVKAHVVDKIAKLEKKPEQQQACVKQH